MALGNVVRFDGIRGYGFIAPDGGGDDVFVHLHDVISGTGIQTGSRVEFQSTEGERGLKAYDVRVLSAYESANHDPAKSAPTVRAANRSENHADDETCDVLSVTEFTNEITELLMSSAPNITLAQMAQIRGSMISLARGHGWVD